LARSESTALGRRRAQRHLAAVVLEANLIEIKARLA
jgi:hypothetical protein